MTAIEEFLHDLEPSVRTSDGVRRNAGTLYALRKFDLVETSLKARLIRPISI